MSNSREELKQKLQTMNNKGANVHTINKALYYVDHLNDYRIALVKEACDSRDWRRVKNALSRLF